MLYVAVSQQLMLDRALVESFMRYVFGRFDVASAKVLPVAALPVHVSLSKLCLLLDYVCRGYVG